MLLKHVVRGTIVEFTVTFTDQACQPLNPERAVVHIDYPSAGSRSLASVNMAEAESGSWKAFWDSSVSDRGRVHWFAISENPKSVDQGEFELDANLANMDTLND